MVHEVIDKLVAKNLVNNERFAELTLAPEKEGLWPQKNCLSYSKEEFKKRFQIKQFLMIPTIGKY